jgi:hypothetical protein
MSISFFSNDAPVKIEEFECCDRPSCRHCDGSGVDRIEFQEDIQMSNSNALELLQCLGEPSEYGGSWGPEDYPRVRRACMRFLSREQDPAIQGSVEMGPRRVEVRSDGVSEIVRGASVLRQLRPAGYLHGRVSEIRDYVARAQKEGWESVCWG